jgi:ABC-type oligopeptide transport system substrate-binding subunit
MDMTKRSFLFIVLLIPGCTCVPNSPYRAEEAGANYLYTSFEEPPKHLDPAISYSSSEYEFIGQIYEPPFQYPYLKRPYQAVPLTAEAIPEPAYYDAAGQKLPPGAPAGQVHRAVYEIRIKPGILYQNHPCFARDGQGQPLYRQLTDAEMKGIESPEDFPKKGTRELVAADYVHQIKRMADPRLNCPILSTLSKYVLGLEEYAQTLAEALEAERTVRKENAGATYNQDTDERLNPVTIDLEAYPFPGIETVDRHRFRIILKQKYPQMLYWLTMPFFAPMPPEAIAFYDQGPLQDRNITIDQFPVGTGPYRMESYKGNQKIVLARNENFHDERYPAEGEPPDLERGLLQDAGKRLPFIDKLVYILEKEALPRWYKFRQGYYDSSGISSDSFDSAIQFSTHGPELTDELSDRGIRLQTAVRSSILYLGFNMRDDLVGGYTDEKRKLRRAIAIAIDTEERIDIFNNGRGIPAHGFLPPGIFGHQEGEAGRNPFVYAWDGARGGPVRKPIEEAKRLLAEAGYPNGKNREGRPLIISFDNAWTSAGMTPLMNWLVKQLRKIDVELKIQTTDYNRFREKMLSGNFQLFSWGWNADYPDPENFFFLLYGPNGKVEHHGENASNYANPAFDELFREMENMDNVPERLGIIRKMDRIIQEDAPLIGGYYPEDYLLIHDWHQNVKPNLMSNNTQKYERIDEALRTQKRTEWNTPRWGLLGILLAAMLGGSVALGCGIALLHKGRRESVVS